MASTQCQFSTTRNSFELLFDTSFTLDCSRANHRVTIDFNFASSDQVKKRFPTLGHMEEAGIITENERKIIEGLDEKCIQVGSG